MPLPTEPITLDAEQIGELNKKLSVLRHEMNGKLSQIVAAAEIMRLQPERTEAMLKNLAEKPHQVAASLSHFSTELEKALQIRPG